ncbi:hypothetical protein RB653_000982 [Dictyostelium firmibasis]|uniref:Store-operated calcium entry-associated regulatory factor n=1 Tax=Dictyostelium firmibasis TaxID=79012 RepID=A0AAN7Z1P2_9MYCE
MKNNYILFLILIISSLFISTQVVESSGRHGGYREGGESKVLLKDVQVLTLRSGRMTKARRSSPIKQIECIGGSAKNEYQLYPKTMQCYNMGSNGVDVQWKCDATLDSSVRLGTIDVSCEGFSYPEDPYITEGSCGVFYELEYSNQARRKAALAEDETSWFEIICVIVVIAFIFYAVFNWCGSPQDAPQDNNNNNTASDNNNPPGDGNGNYYNGSYQGYPNLNNNGGYRNNYNNPGCANNGGGGGWRPGLWTGLGLGYLFGRSQYNNHYYTPSPSYRPRTYYGGGGGSGISSSSSSYSSTSRR